MNAAMNIHIYISFITNFLVYGTRVRACALKLVRSPRLCITVYVPYRACRIRATHTRQNASTNFRDNTGEILQLDDLMVEDKFQWITKSQIAQILGSFQYAWILFLVSQIWNQQGISWGKNVKENQ